MRMSNVSIGNIDSRNKAISSHGKISWKMIFRCRFHHIYFLSCGITLPPSSYIEGAHLCAWIWKMYVDSLPVCGETTRYVGTAVELAITLLDIAKIHRASTC
jgi:hypothetical protein